MPRGENVLILREDHVTFLRFQRGSLRKWPGGEASPALQGGTCVRNCNDPTLWIITVSSGNVPDFYSTA